MPDKNIDTQTPKYQKVHVAKNKNDEGAKLLPTDFDGSLALGTISVSFPGVIGLEFKSTDGLYEQLLMDREKAFFFEPSDGWANKKFIVICKKEEPVPEIVQIGKDMHELRDTLTFEVHALRRDVDKQIKDLDTRITDLDKRVTDLDKRLSELTTKINQMETNLLAMESNLLAAVMDKKNYMLQVFIAGVSVLSIIIASQHVRVAKNQSGEEEISLPTDFDGSLPLRTVDVFFPGAIGLEFKSTDGLFRQLLMNREKKFFYEPSDGWADKTFVVICKKEEPVQTKDKGTPEIVQIKKELNELKIDLNKVKSDYESLEREIRWSEFRIKTFILQVLQNISMFLVMLMSLIIIFRSIKSLKEK